jgi:hypothetical protein
MIDRLRRGRKNAVEKTPGREEGRKKKNFIAIACAGRKWTGATLPFHSVCLTAVSGHR